MAEQEWPVTNLVLLGRAGNGKSSTGNTIIDKKYFEVNFLGEDMDQRCKMFRAAIKDGPIINVIDTPGLFESSVSGDYLSKEIMNCLTMAEEGIHSVLFVLSITNRISQREEFTFNILQHIFDYKILDYFIVVFTGGDELEADNQTLDDYLREGCPEFLTRVLKLCGGRKVLFNNKTNDKGERTKQLNQLLAHVTDIRKQNGGIPYTEKMHRKIKEENDKLREQESNIDAKNLAEEGLPMMKQKLLVDHDQTMDTKIQPYMKNMLKQSTTTHEREMSHIEDTQTMNMMLENELKQSVIAHEREMSQLKDTQTMNMVKQMMETTLKQIAMVHERDMCQLKDTLQLKDTQTINMVTQMNAETYEREMRQLKDIIQQKDRLTMEMMEKMMENALKQSEIAHERGMHHQSSRKGKGVTCECNIM